MKRRSKAQTIPDAAPDGMGNLDYLNKSQEGLNFEQWTRHKAFFVGILSTSVTHKVWRESVDKALRMVKK